MLLTTEEADEARMLALRGMMGMFGVTQSVLSERSGVPQPTISDILTGRTAPKRETLDLLLWAAVRGGTPPTGYRRRRRKGGAHANHAPV